MAAECRSPTPTGTMSPTEGLAEGLVILPSVTDAVAGGGSSGQLSSPSAPGSGAPYDGAVGYAGEARDSLGIVRTSSTSSASSPQSSRSGTASRVLPGPGRAMALAQYLPALLFLGVSTILRGLDQDSVEHEQRGASRA